MPEVRKLNGPRGGMPMGPVGKFNKKSFKRLLKYMLKYKWLYFIVIICILINSIVQVLNQLFLKTLIDDYIMPLIGKSNPLYGDLFIFLCKMAVLYFIGIICIFVYNRIMVFVSQKILRNVRDDMFNHMESLPISYFDRTTHGDIMSRYTNDTDTLRQMLGQSLPNLIGSVFSLITIFISMLTLNIPLTFLVLFGLISMLFITKNIIKKSSYHFIKQQESLGKLNGYIEEMIDGQKVIKVFTHEEEAKRQFDKLNNELCDHSTKANGLGNIMGPVTNNVGNIIYVIIAFVGGFSAVKWGIFSLGSISSFLVLTRNFTHPIMQITQQFNSVVTALAGAERIFNLMDSPSEENNGKVRLVNAIYNGDEISESDTWTGKWAWKNENKLIPLKGDVRLKNVNFGYVPEKEVLHDISLYAKPGQKIAFVGSTGAGKTTVTNLITRFYDASDGVITYDGIDIKEINKKDLRRSLGMVLQDTNLFTGTIMDNIRYGRRRASDKECIEAAKLANADGFIRMLPEGYNTVITGNGANLSGGQRQLIAIARCAVANPPAMILDEATSSIDTRTEAIVQKGMDGLMDGRTVFVIAHRLSTVKNSKAIMVMEGGRIIERGNHDTLISQHGRYYQLYTGDLELE